MKAEIPKGTRIVFPVGDEEVVSVGVQLSAWSGLEVYTCNGSEVLRLRNERSSTKQTFEVGNLEKHSVEFRAWVEDGGPRAQAYVDGLLAHDDLLADVRHQLHRRRKLRRAAAALAAVCAGAAALVSFAL